jgi:PAS domain S-box-containing protein
MLSGIQERDAHLQDARSLLEQRVEERTHDLQRELAERRRAEQELKKSQMLLAEAQRLAHFGSWEWDSSRNAVTLSDETYRVFGRERGEETESYDFFMDALHPTDRTRVREGLREAVAARTEWSGEFRVIPPEGELRWVHGYAKVLPGDTEGSVRVVGTLQDITGRKAGEEERAQLIREQAARAEAESARRQAAFLAEVGATLASTLDDGATLASIARLAVPEVADWAVVLVVNDGVPEPVAAEHADPSRLADLWELARRPSDPSNSGGVYDVIRTGEARLFPTLPPFQQMADPALVRLFEKVGYTSMMLVPLRARNNTFGCLSLGAVGRRFTDADLSLARSLAERGALAADNARLYREAQDANRMKDEFLATLSHELRTPLNAIVGWTKLLQDGQLDASTQARAISTIDRNARAQTQLIEDILDVSRIVAGKLNLDVRAMDLGAVIEGALDSVRHAAEAKGVRLMTEIARTVGPFEGDPDRLQQVAWNLVSNAIKFSTRGGTVRVRLRQDGDQAEISVQDDGLGIKAEFLPHVFERFRQADSSSTRPHGGLGLGLAIVRHLVELHGGLVEVASAGEGKGATFTVRLPLHQGDSAPEVPRRPDEDRERFAAFGRRRARRRGRGGRARADPHHARAARRGRRHRVLRPRGTGRPRPRSSRRAAERHRDAGNGRLQLHARGARAAGGPRRTDPRRRPHRVRASGRQGRCPARGLPAPRSEARPAGGAGRGRFEPCRAQARGVRQDHSVIWRKFGGLQGPGDDNLDSPQPLVLESPPVRYI